MTDAFAKLNDGAPYDLAIMGIGAYDPWIWAHSTPEQAVAWRMRPARVSSCRCITRRFV